mmetsp:Transcript_401/g.656  ORF Transcript_401/g.656 Transcript_401/m.656 type:complete len:634 (-) Transcript_401:1443-3344(-)
MTEPNDDKAATATEKRPREEEGATSAVEEPPSKLAKNGEEGPENGGAEPVNDQKESKETASSDAPGASEESKTFDSAAAETPKEVGEKPKDGGKDEGGDEGTETTDPPATPTGTNVEAGAAPAGTAPSVDASAATTPSSQVAPSSAPSSLPSGLPPGLPGAGEASAVVMSATRAPDNPYAANGVPNPEAMVEEKGEVSALYVGRVIGKGGEMIRDLQARSACRIDVDQNVPPGQPRLITYRGTRKTVDFAKHLVHMLCQENVNEADLPLGEAKREYLIVPATSVGKIIGRGGEMIRELQARSHAKIQVDHSGSSGLDTNEKQVTITGTDQSVVKAKEMVLFLVANPNMDAMQSLNMLVEDKVSRGGVWGSGPPYPNLPNNGQNMQPGASGGGYGAGGGYGGYDQSYYGGGPPVAPGYGAPPVAGGYGAPAVAAPVYQQPPPASYGGGVESEVFFASKSFMGRIIGSKGVTINDLQRRSACDIQINQDVPPGRDCEITIRGTRQGIEMAKQMLREIIEIGPNHPYAGGQSYGGGYQQGGYGMQQQQPYGYGRYDQQQAYGQAYGQSSGYQGGGPPAQQYAQAAPYQAPPQAPYGVPPAAPPVSEWKTATAPDGQVYYYNERSGETTWQKPPGMP